MELEIHPEPSPKEREAIALALERLIAAKPPPSACASGWRRAGVAENVETARTVYATARPRSRPGATRA